MGDGSHDRWTALAREARERVRLRERERIEAKEASWAKWVEEQRSNAMAKLRQAGSSLPLVRWTTAERDVEAGGDWNKNRITGSGGPGLWLSRNEAGDAVCLDRARAKALRGTGRHGGERAAARFIELAEDHRDVCLRAGSRLDSSSGIAGESDQRNRATGSRGPANRKGRAGPPSVAVIGGSIRCGGAAACVYGCVAKGRKPAGNQLEGFAQQGPRYCVCFVPWRLPGALPPRRAGVVPQRFGGAEEEKHGSRCTGTGARREQGGPRREGGGSIEEEVDRQCDSHELATMQQVTVFAPETVCGQVSSIRSRGFLWERGPCGMEAPTPLVWELIKVCHLLDRSVRWR